MSIRDRADERKPTKNIFLQAGGEVAWNSDDVRIFLCTAAVSCVPEQKDMWQQRDSNAQKHARTITHPFMHTPMYFSMHGSKHALLAHILSYRRTIVSVCAEKYHVHVPRMIRW